MIAKRHMTLIEVIIAMTLVSVLLTALMGYYGQIEIIRYDVDRAQDEGFQLRYLQARLAYVLPRILPFKWPQKESEKSRDYFFFTTGSEGGSPQFSDLVFSYDNGIDLDEKFSNNVLGRLFVEETDDNNYLILATWPVPRCWTKEDESPPIRKEVLIDRVEELQFAFFHPPEEPEKVRRTPSAIGGPTIAGEVEIERNQWYTNWNQSFKALPAIVKVRIKRSVQTGVTPPSEWLDLVYPLPNAKAPIVVSGG
jgi:type II secretory pathway pseudopilin PulG